MPGLPLLHLVNGGATLERLNATDLPGWRVAWEDVLCEGPCPAGLDEEAWLRVRARYLADMGYEVEGAAWRRLSIWEQVIADAGRFDEVVIWCEHDLFDQANLIRLVTRLAPARRIGTRVSLVSVDRFPGIARFIGLGQLSAAQLASLWPGRRELTDADVRCASEAWQAWCKSEPLDLERLTREALPLPFLAAALLRQCEEYPGGDDGLSRTERQAIAALASGARSGAEIVTLVQAGEAAPFQSDWSLFAVLRGLESGPRPLVAIEGERWIPAGNAWRVGLTADGQGVLIGRDDAVHLRGIDRWLGGVHLLGRDAPWRWDTTARRLVPGPVR